GWTSTPGPSGGAAHQPSSACWITSRWSSTSSTPRSSSDRNWWLASDLAELVTHSPLYPDHVLGVGGASATLARWTPRPTAPRALDLGTGCGVQSFHLAGHCAHVTATDVSERALRFARFNLALNEVSAELRQGDMFAPVAGETFDLVVSNPPFVITPRDGQVPEYSYRDAGLAGDAIVRQLVREVGSVLAPDGIAQFLGNWEFAGDWTERVGGWLDESGLDGWIVQREVQDPAEYAEVWLADGGHHQGSPGYERMYEAWLDDFAARGVEGIGFGVITLRRSDRGLRRIEELTGELPEPMGATVLGVLRAHDWVRERDDAQLLAARFVVPGDVTEERYGRPGAEDPEVIQLRQGGGLRRVVRADTALAGCVGACDGQLSLGQIVGALGVLLEEEAEALRARLVPAVRALIVDGLLKPAGEVSETR
ncbi:MAG TPA: methyltransferase, partial [Mycobacteriales bacterium]|nr:methyltransferase [Mycobacteriales bacterium]